MVVIDADMAENEALLRIYRVLGLGIILIKLSIGEVTPLGKLQHIIVKVGDKTVDHTSGLSSRSSHIKPEVISEVLSRLHRFVKTVAKPSARISVSRNYAEVFASKSYEVYLLSRVVSRCAHSELNGIKMTAVSTRPEIGSRLDSEIEGKVKVASRGISKLSLMIGISAYALVTEIYIVFIAFFEQISVLGRALRILGIFGSSTARMCAGNYATLHIFGAYPKITIKYLLDIRSAVPLGTCGHIGGILRHCRLNCEHRHRKKSRHHKHGEE